MAWFLHTDQRDYVILDSSETLDRKGVREFASSEEAQDFLRGFLGDVFSMSVLRDAVKERQPSKDVSNWRDHQIIDAIAWELASGRLRLVDEVAWRQAHGQPGKPDGPDKPDKPDGPEPIEKPTNTVTPHLAMEYKVVLLDRNLAQHQEGTETKIYADVTRVEMWYSQTNGSIPYEKGATFTCSPANAEVYKDEACATKLDGPLTPEDIEGGKRMRLYLRGKTAGKFTAKFQLKDPENGQILLADNPAQEEMGVVTLELRLHQQNATAIAALKVDPDTDPVDTYYTNLKNQALPAQKEMTDEEKVKNGRLLHVQKDGNFSRAKLILKKLNAAEWPSGTDDYEVCLNEQNTTGSSALHGHEWNNDLKAFPVKVKVSDLKTADKEYWVEGKSAVKALRAVKLDAGLDRDAGGLTKKAKRHGDWARLTVVQIKEVKLDYTPEAGKAAAWDAAHNKYYINLKADPDGRKITIAATLSEKIKDIPLHFMLAEEKNNRKTANWGIDFPDYWKWKDIPAALKVKDKNNRKDIVHLSAKTNDNGVAKKELQLSRFGGDQYFPAAYIDQDPHLAKFIDGHSDLEKKKPVMAAKKFTAWREVWYQVSRPKDTAMPAAGGFEGSQNKVFLHTNLLEEKQMIKANFTVDPLRPAWQFRPGAGDDLKLCIGTHNVDDAMKLFVAETTATKPKFHVILCDEQFDAKGLVTKVQNTVFDSPNARVVHMQVTNLSNGYVTIFDPPLQGGNLIVSAEWEAFAYDNTTNSWNLVHEGTLPAGNIKVKKTRASKRDVEVTPPTTCAGGAGGCPCGGAATAINPDANHAVRVTFQLRAADGGYNGWAPRNTAANVVRGGRPAYAIHNTMGHELGHLFGQVRTKNVPGLPDHPKMYEKRGGSGPHCSFNATWNGDPTAPALDPTKPGELDAQGKGAGKWDDGDCIIFGYTVDKKREWCKYCAFELLVSDLSKFR